MNSFAAEVQALVDRSAITDRLHRYTRGMDRHDREMVRSAYHDDAIDGTARWRSGSRISLTGPLHIMRSSCTISTTSRTSHPNGW